MLSDVIINLLAQLVYLDIPPRTGPAPTVGEIAEYYLEDPVGGAYLKARFGSIPLEYAGWRAFLEEGIDEIRDWRPVHVMNRNRPGQSGFYACAYESPEGELVVAFRGSEMLGNKRYRNDYETDFALAYEDVTPQQAAAEEYLRGLGELRRRDYWLTGYSLGGNLALHGALHVPVPDRLMGCRAFNGPGFNHGYLRANRRRIGEFRPKLVAYQNEHDIVSSLLLDLVEPVVISSLYHPEEQEGGGVGAFFYPHSNFVFRKENGRFLPNGDGKKDPLCRRINRLTRLFLLLPDAVKRVVCGMLLDAVYSAQPPKRQLEFLLEQVTQYMLHSQVPDMGPDSLAASAVFYAARVPGASDRDDGELYRELLARDSESRADLAGAGILLFRLLQEGCRERASAAAPGDGLPGGERTA